MPCQATEDPETRIYRSEQRADQRGIHSTGWSGPEWEERSAGPGYGDDLRDRNSHQRTAQYNGRIPAEGVCERLVQRKGADYPDSSKAEGQTKRLLYQ